ncbi:MAG: ester cyclase [Actinomycetota bacterium]
MSETNKATVRRLYEVFSKGAIEDLADIATADYVEHNPLPGQGTGLQGLKDRMTMLRDGLAPSFTIEDVIAEGNRVVVRWTNSGRHIGDFAGIPATSKAFTIAGMDIYRVEQGKLAEHWDVVDQLSLLQQLGLLPAPQGAEA